MKFKRGYVWICEECKFEGGSKCVNISTSSKPYTLCPLKDKESKIIYIS